jgi:hypothetical protein
MIFCHPKGTTLRTSCIRGKIFRPQWLVKEFEIYNSKALSLCLEESGADRTSKRKRTIQISAHKINMLKIDSESSQREPSIK